MRLEWVGSKLPDLSPAQREVVQLFLAFLTNAEIAERLGKSEDAVKMLKYRAFKRLRKWWDAEHPES